MRRRIVLELLATAGCTFSGAMLWSEESPGPLLAGPSGVHSADRFAAETSASAAADSRTRRAVAEADAIARESAASDSVAPQGGPVATAASPLSAPSVRRAPRAARSSIAPIPTLVGPAPPRVPEALARAALRFVGKDAAAEELWTEAIDDLGLAEEARSDLIEDLNDEGYPDPDNLTAADLPLIVERLRIIERHAPYAADGVNAAAFEEAYKDLLKMWVRLRGAARK